MMPDISHTGTPESPQPIIAQAKGPSTNPRAVYVHWPFCETKCGYCDFYSIPLAGRRAAPLLEAVLRELALRLQGVEGRIETIFVGGGTPTTLGSDDLSQLLIALGRHTACRDVTEFSVEANPATIDASKAAALVDSGVNRVSIGAQSFQPDELLFLERIHQVSDVAEAVATVTDAGITNISLDLMFGIGGQTMASWRDSIRQALALSPQHIACYGLTYEAGTKLTAMRDRGQIKPCDEEIEADMYLLAIDEFTAAGFEQYEISNFARPGFRCRHNLIYWCSDPFVGVGPSAAGFYGGRRYRNVPSIEGYAKRLAEGALPESESEEVKHLRYAIESLMMALRLTDGIDLDAFAERTGIDLRQACATSLARLREANLIDDRAERLRLTRSGLLVADSVLAELVRDLDTERGISLPVVHTH